LGSVRPRDVRIARGNSVTEPFMVDTIESFVERLQQEGVEAGRNEARKIIEEARAEAERILNEAREQARRIDSEARAEAERTLRQGREELDLAGRDVVLRLREVMGQCLEAVLQQAAEKALRDEVFLKRLLHDIIVEYARRDAEGDRTIDINLSEDMAEALSGWAIREMTAEGGQRAVPIDLHARLRSAGFEYAVSGGKVEVTPESVGAALSRMVAPRLREVIDRALERKEG